MYKSFNTKRYHISISTFKKKAKDISKVYHTGIRLWESDDAKNYSIVINTFRIIFSINKDIYTCNG